MANYEERQIQALRSLEEAIREGKGVVTEDPVTGYGSPANPVTIPADAIAFDRLAPDVRAKINARAADGGLAHVVVSAPISGAGTAESPLTIPAGAINKDRLSNALQLELTKLVESARLDGNELVIVLSGADPVEVDLSPLAGAGTSDSTTPAPSPADALTRAQVEKGEAVDAKFTGGAWVQDGAVAHQFWDQTALPTLAAVQGAAYSGSYTASWGANQVAVVRVPVGEKSAVEGNEWRLKADEDYYPSNPPGGGWFHIGDTTQYTYWYRNLGDAGSGAVAAQALSAVQIEDDALSANIARTGDLPPAGLDQDAVDARIADRVPASARVPAYAAGDVGQFLGVRDNAGTPEAAFTPVPAPTEVQVYGLAKTILQAGLGIGIKTMDAARRIVLRALGVPSGNTLPPKPWHIGQRFILLTQDSVPNNLRAVYLEAESTPTETVWQLPGQQLQIRSYSLAHDRAEFRNKTYLLRTGTYAFPPDSGDTAGDIKLTWYRSDADAETQFTVTRQPVANYVHWHLIQNGTFDVFGTTETQFDYLWNLAFGTSKVNPDTDVDPGDISFAGSGGEAGWVRSPGVAAWWAVQGQPKPGSNLALDILLDGPATGLTYVSGSAQDKAGPWIDLSIDLVGKAGSIQFSVPMVLSQLTAADVGWGERGIPKATTFRDFVFVKDVLALAADATLLGDSKDVYEGSTKDAKIQLQFGWAADGAKKKLRCRFYRDGDRTSIGYALGPNGDARVELWHQEPVARTGFILEAKPAADVDVTTPADMSWSAPAELCRMAALSAEQAADKIHFSAKGIGEAQGNANGGGDRLATKVELMLNRAGNDSVESEFRPYGPRFLGLGAGSQSTDFVTSTRFVDLHDRYITTTAEAGDVYWLRVYHASQQTAARTVKWKRAKVCLKAWRD